MRRRGVLPSQKVGGLVRSLSSAATEMEATALAGKRSIRLAAALKLIQPFAAR